MFWDQIQHLVLADHFAGSDPHNMGIFGVVCQKSQFPVIHEERMSHQIIMQCGGKLKQMYEDPFDKESEQ